MLYPQIDTELLPQTDEGEVNVNAELARRHAHRAHRGSRCCMLEETVKQFVPEATTHHHPGRRRRQQLAGRRRQHAAAARSASCWCRATSARAPTKRSPIALRRQLAGLPGVVVRANPSGGNNQIMRFLSGGGKTTTAGQPPAAGDPRPRPRRCAAPGAGRARR